ncbi:MAG: hypothetical protein ACR2JB_11665 [Bryobacteraceae bacterium]
MCGKGPPQFREARFGNWDKNDPKDAQVMLAMMAQGFVQVYYDPLFSGSHDWQELSNTYFQITVARTRLQHSLLSHHLPLYFPEFTRYWLSTRSEWFIRFLIRFPTPAAIRALDRENFIAEAWDLVGRKVSKRAKLEEMYLLASESIGLPLSLDSPAIETFRLQLGRYLELNCQRNQLDLRAQELLASNADFQRLQNTSRDRRDHSANYSLRCRRSSAVPSSPAVFEVLRLGSRQKPVGPKQRA